MISFEEFHKKLIKSFGGCNKSKQEIEKMGYTGKEKDSGFTSWLNFTGLNRDDYIGEFSRVVYGHEPDQALRPIQMELF